MLPWRNTFIRSGPLGNIWYKEMEGMMIGTKKGRKKKKKVSLSVRKPEIGQMTILG